VRRTHVGRLLFLLSIFAFALAAIVARLAVLQVGEHATFSALGEEQRIRHIRLPATRGQILDRTGEPLAMSLPARDVYADPRYVVHAGRDAKELAPLLGQPAPRLERALRERGPSFVYLARQVDEHAAAQVARLHLPGIASLPVSKRYYPAGDVASQVLGFVGLDGTGLSGLELQYQAMLSGTAGERVQEMDPQGRPIPSGVSTDRPPIAGQDLVTTIDRPLQYQVQTALATAVADNRAQGGTVIVMNPSDGDVYAMATYPGFDPNRFESYGPRALQERSRNRAITDVFEPGSVNKVITAAAAVEEHALPLDERLAVSDRIRVGTATIHDSHPHAVERMTLGDIIAQSSNVGITEVADRLGSGPLATYLTKFGFGRPTGVGFPGEAEGVLLPLLQWSDTSRATMAFGQGISATPLQMAAVYATVANGGTWVQPRLARGAVDAAGRYHAFAPSPAHSVVSARTAETVTRMLAYVVEGGTGTAARIDGYQVAGKTGTARIPYADRAGYSHRYVASFMGFLPASNPQVVIVSILDQPATVYGGIAAAPLFQQVARFAIQRLGIPAGPALPLPPHALPAR
jgi:cell division protein FtsI (penicillin-binding protein 3)